MRRFSQDFKILQNADRLASRIFLAVTIFFAVFIIFASCSPVTSAKYKLKPTVFMQLFSVHSMERLFTQQHLGDISANVLFYIPLGLFLSLAVSFRKPAFLTPWLLIGFMLSTSMEVVQYFIGRYPDPVDMITNTLGFVFGFELGVAAIKIFGLRPAVVLGINPDNQTSAKINAVAAMRFLYMGVYLISSFLPFDVTFDWSHIFAKIHPDKSGQVRIILDPLYHFKHWKHDADIVIGLFLGLLPVGILTALLSGLKRRLSLASPVLMCLALAAVCELGQIFVYSRTSDVSMLTVAILAGVAGWLINRVWFMLQDLEGYSSFENDRHRNEFLLMVTAVYVLFLFAAALAPYRFEFSLKAIEQKMLYQTNLVPFQNQLGMRNLSMTFWLLRDVGAFIPLGLLLTFCMRVFRPGFSKPAVLGMVALFCSLLAVVLELLKTTGVGRYADLTVVLLACTGGILGGVFFRFLTKPAAISS
jgi:VanZ family protein